MIRVAIRKRVALDVDFTVADIGSVMLRLHNMSVSGSYKTDDIVDWHWESVNMTSEQFVDTYVKAWNEHTRDIPITMDVSLLRSAQQFYDIELVTSRKNSKGFEDTVDALKEWMTLNGIGDVPLVLSNAHEHKSSLDYDFFVDDSPALARAMSESAEKGKVLFVIDAPYNRDVKDSENVLRVRNANEALVRLAAMANGLLVPEHE